MAGRAEHRADRQPDGRAGGKRAGAKRNGGDGASPSRASIPELPAVGLDAVGAAVLVCAADGTIVDLNRAAALLLGVDPVADPRRQPARSAAVGRDVGDRVG